MYALNFLFQYKSIGIGFKMEWDGVMRRGTGAMDEWRRIRHKTNLFISCSACLTFSSSVRTSPSASTLSLSPSSMSGSDGIEGELRETLDLTDSTFEGIALEIQGLGASHGDFLPL